MNKDDDKDFGEFIKDELPEEYEEYLKIRDAGKNNGKTIRDGLFSVMLTIMFILIFIMLAKLGILK